MAPASKSKAQVPGITVEPLETTTLGAPGGAGVVVGGFGGSATEMLVGGGPSALIDSASITTLTDAEKAGDLSASVVPLWDYASCLSTLVCVPFLGPSIIPPSRLSPFWGRAMQALPEPNATGTTPNALMQTSGSFSGSHFVINAQNNCALSNFGGIVELSYGPFNLLGSTFTLYIDGVAIVANSLPYVPAYRCAAAGPFCFAAPGPVVYPPQLEEEGC